MKTRLRQKNSGMTLIELIVVIAILGILSTLAIPRFSGYIALAKERVCSTNRAQMERLYLGFLVMEGKDHTDILFDKFILENDSDLCPEDGILRYEDEKVNCSIHSKDDSHDENVDDETDPGGEIPWL